uniref:Uncharacterized protein n=1 Tax=Tetranychus urticae TaxID=32264 RepID=T1KKC4_TETUR
MVLLPASTWPMKTTLTCCFLTDLSLDSETLFLPPFLFLLTNFSLVAPSPPSSASFSFSTASSVMSISSSSSPSSSPSSSISPSSTSSQSSTGSCDSTWSDCELLTFAPLDD